MYMVYLYVHIRIYMQIHQLQYNNLLLHFGGSNIEAYRRLQEVGETSTRRTGVNLEKRKGPKG